MSECFNFIIVFENKTEKLQVPLESEFFQLKMLICVKFKIYDLSKYFVYNQENLLDNIPDSEPLSNLFFINYENFLCIKNEKNEISLNSQNIISDPNKEEKKYKIAYLCACNNKNEASNICVKCSKIICDSCRQREPHIIHLNNIIKVSNFPEYIKKFNEKTFTKLTSQIASSESYIFLQDFRHHIKTDIGTINKNFEYAKQLLEDMKELQVGYLLSLEVKLSLEQRYRELEKNINDTSESVISYEESKTEDLEVMLNHRNKISNLNDDIESKFTTLSRHLDVYMQSIKELSVFNKQIISNIKEKTLQSQTNFNLSTLNTRISAVSKFSKHESNKNKNIKKEQPIMRIKDPHTILYYQFSNKDKILRTRQFKDNCNFKYSCQENDQLELNIQNKLFIITGKKFKQLFYYDFDKNEIFHLEDLKNPHFYGSLVYVPINNSIYCLGGNNSNKCELYRNDEIIYSDYTPDIRLHNKNNQWVEIAEMNHHRQEFSAILFNSYLYAFFGFDHSNNKNTNSIERINVVKNENWEIVNVSNPAVPLSSHANLLFNDKEILILGGYDGKNYSDKIFKYNPNTNYFSIADFKIPNLKKNSYYNFFKENSFVCIKDEKNIEEENNFNFSIFDNKNRLHLFKSQQNIYEVIVYNNID